VATEERLETRFVAGAQRRTVAVTMRTPGNDFELAAGFLFGEFVLSHSSEVSRISHCVDRDIDPEQRYNILNVELRARRLPDLESLERHFFTSSARRGVR
jgi:FdhD protein